MSDKKCPICGNDLEHYHTGLVCYRHCLNGKNVWGSEETLKDLDRTHKALEIAVDALKELYQATHYDKNNYVGKVCNKAIEQINEIKGGKDGSN